MNCRSTIYEFLSITDHPGSSLDHCRSIADYERSTADNHWSIADLYRQSVMEH